MSEEKNIEVTEEVTRAAREAESREVQARPKTSWEPQSKLPKPDHQEGWVFRWVATSILGQPNNVNVSAKSSVLSPSLISFSINARVSS